jgi:glycosyltransferase involved in cell wall biosynthesis
VPKLGVRSQCQMAEKVIVVQTVATEYNLPVFERLRDALHGEFRVYAGSEFFEPTVRHSLRPDLITELDNHFFFGRRLLWQSGMWRSLLAADSAIAEFNPRILSTWALLLARRLVSKRTVLWGHAWPRAGRAQRSIWVRKLMGNLADAVVVYTETQARELRELMPEMTIIAAPNALYAASSMGAVTIDIPNNILFVGRLVSSKKPALLLEAFSKAQPSLPHESILTFVGEGPELERLRKRTDELGLERRVQFVGHVSDFDALRDLYGRSLISVSPGYVGLSITQSFAFGVPMLISRREPHAPEIEAALEGENALFFAENNADALAAALIAVFHEKQRWIDSRDQIARSCAASYSIEQMASRLMSAAATADAP